MKYYNCIDSIKIENKELENIINSKSLSLFFKPKEGGISANYVGFILKENFVLTIYPKNFLEDKEFQYIGKIDESFELLSKILIEFKKKSGLVNEKEDMESFPLKAYLNICEYYLNHGLYLQSDKYYRKGFGGKINWTRTMSQSSKLISKDKNLLFIPFVIEEKDYKNVFITECMKYVLEDGYENFGYHFNVGVPYKESIKNRIIGNKNMTIKKLKLLKRNYFKDVEKYLIDNLITYFEWENKLSEKGFLLTNTFNAYWEIMVEGYLNRNLEDICEVSNIMKFKDNVYSYNFNKKEDKIFNKVDSTKEVVNKSYKLEYDHFYKRNNTIYLYDSKYYKEIKGLDYKQVFYDIFLKERFKDCNIINGLIIPTNKKYHTRIHFDPIKDTYGYLNDIYITEHYLNFKEVIKSYLKQ